MGLYKTEMEIQQAKDEAANDNATKTELKIPNCDAHDHGDGPKQLLKYLMKSERTPNYFNDIQHYRVPHGKETEAQKSERLEKEQREKEKDKNKLEPYKEIKARVDLARENPHGREGDSADTYRISTKNYGDVPYALVSRPL